MEKIIEKISNYHIFNYIIPGALFILFINEYIGNMIKLDNFIYFFFSAYFIGIVIGRLSSLITEKLLYYTFNIKKENYDSYIYAEKNDEKIGVLLQDLNMYRNICTMLAMMLIIKLFEILNIYKILGREASILIILLLLIVLFACAYLKQSKYIISRIKVANKKKDY